METIDRTSAQAGDQARCQTGSRAAKSPVKIPGGAARDIIPEQLLARLWQKRAARQEWFKTNGGRQVRVLYPGRPSSSAGPDFRDAVFQLEGLGLVRGAVDLHRRQRDWDFHGHGGDPNYNGVVLHVALEVDGGDTRLQSGQQVPVISLASLLDSAGTPAGGIESGGAGTPAGPSTGDGFSLWALLKEKGYSSPGTAAEVADLLDRAGDARFRQKSARYQAFLREQDPNQTLYEGICEALGYRHNQQPFLKLAQRSPCRALVQAAGALPREQRAGALEAWLLQLSGLVESPGIKLPQVGLGPPLARREWHCFRVRRPIIRGGESPTRRCCWPAFWNPGWWRDCNRRRRAGFPAGSRRPWPSVRGTAGGGRSSVRGAPGTWRSTWCCPSSMLWEPTPRQRKRGKETQTQPSVTPRATSTATNASACFRTTNCSGRCGTGCSTRPGWGPSIPPAANRVCCTCTICSAAAAEPLRAK